MYMESGLVTERHIVHMTKQRTSGLLKSIGICIPTMSIDIDKKVLLGIFDQVHIGKVKDIRIHVNKKFNSSSAFVWFEKLNFNTTDMVDEIIRTLQENKPVCIMYSFPNFIQCYKLKERKE